MSFAEIIAELPNLKREERRELVRRIFEIPGEESDLLSDTDRRADECFKVLDAMEAASFSVASGSVRN